ncbi:MAG: GNAT family N-acetyltransferase [Methanosarcina thermophila]|uniref:Acetyltransferase, GNAT family n=2 Tax=Methanosarcina thermophila TaxID=2210 RepID=A0A3G9CQT4_METTE|nr:GNAT family N-acetyltransferase [Methanosarcina thermophila]ALK04481.1 MAG: acetyltransferase [Methanosarcina sp. 795]NLU57088.1 GNAT family N-acetyltransferase [Methanosarcina thermophila]BAW28114.1 acetyltransferase, GNAT family [Methanosarcina thermophila]GLI13199.1 acetyltransferase [Methanosarcina thermophila MST-A1]HPZ21373.1 GNAT family N-acetyltransferase [Methanosarcina thermophila]
MQKIVRLYRSQDCKEIVELFYDTVHTINSKDYSSAQLDAWAPEENNIDMWDKSLSSTYTVVIEIKGSIVGFGNLDKTGYLDQLYVHKDFQGQGIATIIVDELEKYAQKHDITIITTEASITAKPFFEKRGYKTVKQQSVERKGLTLINFIMRKLLVK